MTVFFLLFFTFCHLPIGATLHHIPPSSKTRKVAQAAEKALKNGTVDGLETAISLLEDLSSETTFRRLQPDVKIDIYNMLIEAYERKGAFTKQESLITALLQDEAFKPYWISLKARVAESYLSQDQLQKAHNVMKELLRTPKRRLSSQDAEIVTAIYSTIQRHAEKKLRSAEIAFHQKEYAKAASLYQYLFDGVRPQIFPQTFSKESQAAFLDALTMRLALSYYLDEDYEQCSKALGDATLKTDSSKILMALAQKKLGNAKAAFTLFKEAHGTKAAWEACFSAFKAHDIQTARTALKELPDAPETTVLEALLDIEEGSFTHAAELLSSLLKDPSNHYLKGLYYLHLGAKETACEHLEKAILTKSPYQKEALNLLAKSYLELASDNCETSVGEVFLDRAEILLAEEPVSALLAKVYFLRKNLAKLQELESICPHDDERYEISLYIAELSQNFDAVLDSKHKYKKAYPKALVRSKRAHLMNQAFSELIANKILDENYDVFEELIVLLLESNIQAACTYLETALPELKNPATIEKSHWLYTLAACKTQSDKALWLCDQFLQKYPESPYFADVLFQKALIGYRTNDDDLALKALTVLEAEYPHSPHRDEVLFFMGLMYEKKGMDAKPLFYEVFTDYPDSPYGPESYYRYYPEKEYAAKGVQAIAHLKKMPPAYANSLFGVMGALYVAAHDQEACPQNSLSAAQVKAQQEIIDNLSTAIANGKACRPSLPPKMHIRFTLRLLQAEYEKASCYFTLANFKEVITTCTALKSDVLALPEEERPHLTWLKAAFLQSRAFLLQGSEIEAREELALMLKYAETFDCEREEPVILALNELAAVKAKEGDYSTSFDLLNRAQKLQDKSEHLLTILIAKANIHRQMGELDKAMMLLSQVINEQSASSLRIQAMFLRAELYELKGRRDLAFRQLQATAKKGGEWGMRAAKKLEEKYGYE